MLFQFIIWKAASQTVSPDLVPPFISSDNKRIGIWTIGGVSLIYNDYIILAPPMQYHRGSIWSSGQIPTNDWSMQVELNLSEGSGGGGFGIWIIKEYGKEGQLNGGPNNFTGISLIGERNHSNINLQFLSNSIKQSKTVEIINSKIILYIQFSDSSIKIANFHPVTKDFTSLMNISNHFDLSSNYIGITAQSGEYTSLITLTSVTFHIQEDTDLFNFSNQYIKLNEISSINQNTKLTRNPPNNVDNDPHFHPKITHRLRNPAFLSTRTEILQMEEMNGNISCCTEPTKVNHVLNVIDEINEVSFEIASFSDLNRFIDLTITPYAEKWNKRTQQIINYVKNTKNITDEACQTAKKLGQSISNLKNQTFLSLNNSFNSFSMEIENDLLNSSQINPDLLIEELKVDYISQALLVVGIIEFLAFFLICYFCFLKGVLDVSQKKIYNHPLIQREKPD